jgi:hypothetical protein
MKPAAEVCERVSERPPKMKKAGGISRYQGALVSTIYYT